VSDFLQDVLGYDKYAEITTEFAIRSTFCDLAVKVGGRVLYLIEVKSVGTDLKDNHLKQAVDYAANQGVDWVLLTNGVVWKAHRLRFEKPIQADEVFSIDLLDETTKTLALLERLYLVSKDAGGDSAISTFLQQKDATSRYVVAQLLLSEPVTSVVRRELRKLFPGVRIEQVAIADLVRNEVLKRECLEGERATTAERLARKAARKRQRSQVDKLEDLTRAIPLPPTPVLSA
jgi:hypothetical protein